VSETGDRARLEIDVKTRKLGRSGLDIAPLVLGGNVFGWTANEETTFALLDRFAGEGFNAVDTADVYSSWVPGHTGGESEAIIGNWLKARGGRDRVVIATKVGWDMGEGRKGLSKRYIAQAAEASLKRLQTDYIDLYQAHTDDRDTPLEETLEAFAQLIAQGKVRALGASNYDAPRLAQALDTSARLGLPRDESLQPLYNLYDRSTFEGPLESLCVQHGLGVIPYFALAAGFLTGKYRSEQDLSKSPRGARSVKRYLNERGFRILSALDDVAARVTVSPGRTATPTQIALAWLIARPSVTAPIASATSVAQLDDLIAATRITLDRDALATLDAASAETPAPQPAVR
jgi:aryl-alcohol dehydrogenase-like predicted oxidoreductase